MKGDFSRDSFDRRKQFSRVMMQQGRVQIDADWNEQAALGLSFTRTFLSDLLGPGAGPDACCGFAIATAADLAPRSRIDAGRFTPEVRQSLKENERALRRGDLLILPGRYYVGGIAVELGASKLYSEQPGYPFDEPTMLKSINQPGSPWLAYLDVWEEYVAAEQDDSIRDPALDGADTSGRALVRWQIRILPNIGKWEECFSAFATRLSGRLTAWTNARQAAAPTDSALAQAGYRGAENRLYRVEIHKGTDEAGGGTSFKWSRDNGALVRRVNQIDGEHVRLGHGGRDGHSGLEPGNWVELVDDCWTGRNPGGPLGRVLEANVDEPCVSVKWAGASPNLALQAARAGGLRPVLRRWDHQARAADGGAIPIRAGADIELEDGLFVRFEPGGHYRAGDYWLIPARQAIGGILWPGAPERPSARDPDGPTHHYAPIALFKNGKVKDLRRRFKPISR